jgi:hypothetical protein
MAKYVNKYAKDVTPAEKAAITAQQEAARLKSVSNAVTNNQPLVNSTQKGTLAKIAAPSTTAQRDTAGEQAFM